MEQRYVRIIDGRYEADIDITVEEWKSMLKNPKIFGKNYLDMILKWYNEIDHQATTQEVMEKYPSNLKGSPYNGYVIGLTNRILKNLNRFELIYPDGYPDGKESKFIVPFEGWHEKHKKGKKSHFVWKLRDELVQALEELDIVDEQVLPSEEDFLKKETEKFEKALQLSDEELLEKVKKIEARKEKIKTKQVTSQRHYRNADIAAYAIRRANGLCQLCGNVAPFIKPNGTLFLEVHHIQWLSEEGLDVTENTVALCPNCHRKMHILNLKEDKDFLKSSVQKIVD
jgi:5-methylcytosine-specific restriction enzyme A